MVKANVTLLEKEEAKYRTDTNDLVAKSPHGTIFHTLEWLKIIEKNTKSNPG
jgi:hypothetical protein